MPAIGAGPYSDWQQPCNESNARGGSESQARREDHRAIRNTCTKDREATCEGKAVG